MWKKNDEAWFYQAVVSALYPANENILRTSSYSYFSQVLKAD